MSKTVSVFIIDDSAVVRQVLSAIFASDSGIRLAGSASDPLFALQKMQHDWPDVIVLDVEMPRMDGITFLKKLMLERPTPVVICSTLTEKGADTTLQALAAGAVDIVTKPKVGLKDFLESTTQNMLRVVKAAAGARMSRMVASSAAVVSKPAANKNLAQDKKSVQELQGLSDSVGVQEGPTLNVTTEQIVAFGTSTGGTQALEAVLTQFPQTCPGVLVVQHMPEKFTAAFAQRLDRVCRCEVREARDGDRVIAGLVLIAPGGKHMQLRRSGAQYFVSVADGPPVNRHKPSVDVLFRSVARAAGRNALGVIMTGMGDDGAQGLLAMRQAGAHTIAQDKDSCVVYGMPKEAVDIDAACQVLSLKAIAGLFAHNSGAMRRT